MDLYEMRLIRRYKKLLPAGPLTAPQKEELKKLEGRFRLVTSPSDLMKQAFLFQLLGEPQARNIELLSAYDLIDIYLEKDTRYQRLLDITPEVLCVYAGYGEFTNKRLEEAVIQVSENQRVHHNQVWVFYKGSPREMDQRYPVWYRYLTERGYKTLELGTATSTEEVEDI